MAQELASVMNNPSENVFWNALPFLNGEQDSRPPPPPLGTPAPATKADFAPYLRSLGPRFDSLLRGRAILRETRRREAALSGGEDGRSRPHRSSSTARAGGPGSPPPALAGAAGGGSFSSSRPPRAPPGTTLFDAARLAPLVVPRPTSPDPRSSPVSRGSPSSGARGGGGGVAFGGSPSSASRLRGSGAVVASSPHAAPGPSPRSPDSPLPPLAPFPFVPAPLSASGAHGGGSGGPGAVAGAGSGVGPYAYPARGFRPGDALSRARRVIPAIFFEESLQPWDERVWSTELSQAAGDPIARERVASSLSEHADLVDAALVRELRAREADFARAAAAIEGVAADASGVAGLARGAREHVAPSGASLRANHDEFARLNARRRAMAQALAVMADLERASDARRALKEAAFGAADGDGGGRRAPSSPPPSPPPPPPISSSLMADPFGVLDVIGLLRSSLESPQVAELRCVRGALAEAAAAEEAIERGLRDDALERLALAPAQRRELRARAFALAQAGESAFATALGEARDAKDAATPPGAAAPFRSQIGRAHV